MFGKQLSLFRLYGFEVKLDASWALLATLVVWSLARGYFPAEVPGQTAAVYWTISVLGAAGLFGSIIFHEMSHSLVARAYGLPIRGITLFIFGGVAEMEGEPPSARAEFVIAVAGPISSYVLSLGFFILFSISGAAGLSEPLVALLQYLAIINVMLATFNLVPAFPLDGGRVYRAILWQWKGNLTWATHQASRAGSAFGMVLIALGVFKLLRGDVVGGMWLALIGLFLNGAAGASYQQLRARQALEGQQVRRYMSRNPVSVQPQMSLAEVVENYIYVHGHKLFPVVDGERLLGAIDLSQIKDVPQSQWQNVYVREIMSPCSPENMIGAGEDAVRALSVMGRGANSRLLVVEGGQLVGVIALKDILRLLAVKLDLESIG